MSDLATPPPMPIPAAPPAPALKAPRDRTARTIATACALLAFLAAVFAWDAGSRLRALEATAGGRLAELGAEGAQGKAHLARAQAALRDAATRITELEARVADTAEQRVALEDMYRELSKSADDRLLSEIEQTLILASQQLQLAGNVRGALAALQAADQRLARAEKLAVAPLRRALAQDMDRLKALPQVDTVGIAVKLDNLATQVETLPLLIPDALPPGRLPVRAKPVEEAGVARVARGFWEEMKGLVRIRDLETTDAALLAPTQAYFLRENLKLRLLAARMALLARDEATFRDDIRAAQGWVTRYFDGKQPKNVQALATLKQIGESPMSITLPDINASLGAVRTARAAREKAR